MIPSDNPFLIASEIGCHIVNATPKEWVVDVAENGYFKADFLQKGQDLSVTVNLSGVGAKCDLNCVYLCNKNNKINIDFKVLHKSSNTLSSQTVRGLSADKGQVVFNGTIYIPYNSQKCDGHQNHRGIVLSDTAKISATPQLEIWADDVKCAHGSAIGPLDDKQIFYMRTRGLSEQEAKKILLLSFFNGVLSSNFDSYIQDWVKQYV
ncbi:MAG: SufD family Fe-S cluster assembly protein [Pseudomonadota bacterium]|nr:SufD family Fe-S cluster assembly protein [Pseudomonadota bacterium]